MNWSRNCVLFNTVTSESYQGQSVPRVSGCILIAHFGVNWVVSWEGFNCGTLFTIWPCCLCIKWCFIINIERGIQSRTEISVVKQAALSLSSANNNKTPSNKKQGAHSAFVNIHYVAYDNSYKVPPMHYLEGTPDERVSKPKTTQRAFTAAVKNRYTAPYGHVCSRLE